MRTPMIGDPVQPDAGATARWIRAAAAWLLAGSMLFVVLVTLAPFNFQRPSGGVRVHWVPSAGSHARDFVVNILLFVPLGMSVALLCRRSSAPRHVFSAALAGLAVSLAVEILQVFLPARNPTVTDVLYNAGGALAGGAIVAAAGRRVEQLAAGARRVVAVPAPLRGLTLLAALTMQFVLPVACRGPGRLTSWEEHYPLLVGNDVGGNRPWLGLMWDVHLLDRVLSPEEVSLLNDRDPSDTPLARSLVASYRTTGPSPYPDRGGLLPPLTDRPTSHPQPSPADPARLTNDHWLATDSHVSAASARVRESNRFTLVTTLAARVTPQANRRCILAVSGADGRQNLALTQSGKDLYVSARSNLTGPRGARPSFRVPDVFATKDRRRVVLTYGRSEMVVYVDGAERGRQRLMPEAAVLWPLFPSRQWSFTVGDSMFPTSLFYRLVFFLPVNLLVVHLLRHTVRAPGPRLASAVAALLVIGAGNEVLLARLDGGPPRMLNRVVTGTLVVAAMLPLVQDVLLSRRRATLPG